MGMMKAWLSIAVAIVAALTQVVVGDEGLGTLDFSDWLVLALAVLGSGGATWLVSKVSGGKAVAAALSATLTSLTAAVAVDQTITTNEWLTAVGFGLAALVAIYGVPNSEEPLPG